MQFHQRLQKRIQEHKIGTCNIGGNTIVNTKPAFKVKTTSNQQNIMFGYGVFIFYKMVWMNTTLETRLSEERSQRFELIHVMEGMKKISKNG